MEYKAFITSSLQKAALIAKKYFGKARSNIKGEDKTQVLTEADLAIGTLLIEEIQKVFPEHNIIDEEKGVIDNQSDYTWVIDPVDGTANFAQGMPHYGIMLGLLKEDKPVAGGVTMPYFDELYYAETGNGAFCGDKKLDISKSDSSSRVIAYGINGFPDEPEKTRKEMLKLAEIILEYPILNSSNSIYDGVMVLKGSYLANMYTNAKIWDVVVPDILTQEAGGVFTDFFGKKQDYTGVLKNTDKIFTACATSPKVHEKLQTIINNPS